MWKSGLAALAAAVALVPSLAQTDEFDRNMATMWEVLWHQSGTPTRLVRWEQDLKVRVHGEQAAAHRSHALQALRAVAAEARVNVVDVTDQPDAAAQANVSIELVRDSALSAQQPCETRLNFRTETRIDSAVIQMRASDAERCAYHEAMHVMGVRGHPEGKTVLSYFARESHGLMPLDRAMLRAWYSPRTRAGMTPFELLPILGDELVAVAPDRQKAAQSRDRFVAQTVEQMQSFAGGSADVPSIVKRSGKSSDEGIRFGRMQVSYFLGVAYLEGASVRQDAAQGTRWLQRAVELGSRTAQAHLASVANATVAGNR